MSGLKPCLLCEGEAKLLRRSGRAGIACPSKWYRERVECKVCGLTTREYKRPGSAFRSWNKRPQPTTTQCDELVTVAGEYLDGHMWKQMPSYLTDFSLRGIKTRGLVTRQNAEEVIAAKDARIAELDRECDDIADKNNEAVRQLDRAMNGWAKLEEKYEALEADNAAKDAAFKKLEDAWYEAEGKISDLEADNKRLREGLEFYASKGIYNRDGWSDRPAPVITDSGETARAALGEVKT